MKRLLTMIALAMLALPVMAGKGGSAVAPTKDPTIRNGSMASIQPMVPNRPSDRPNIQPQVPNRPSDRPTYGDSGHLNAPSGVWRSDVFVNKARN